MRLGIALSDRDLPDDGGIRAVRLAEDGGAASVWTNETGGADACVTLGAWSAVTERIRLGTGVVPLSARSTATLALAGEQLQRLSGGRLLLGVGVGQRSACERVHGRPWTDPLQWTEQSLAELRGRGFPVLVGALGPKMVDLAARHADGVLFNWTTPEYGAELRQRFAAAATAAGRDPADLVVAGYVRVAAGPDASAALEAQVAFYAKLPFYDRHWAAMGNPPMSAVSLASEDGHDLRDRLEAYGALDTVIARLVPTPEYDVAALVERLCG